MAGINKVILIGNLGRDPETRYAPSGSPVTSFSIATSEKWADKQTGEMKEKTEWHSIVCFARLAELAGDTRRLRKGSKVYVEGKLRTSTYEKNGEKRYSTQIIAGSLQFLDPKSGGEAPSNQAPRRPANAPTLADDNNFEDDIPF